VVPRSPRRWSVFPGTRVAEHPDARLALEPEGRGGHPDVWIVDALERRALGLGIASALAAWFSRDLVPVAIVFMWGALVLRTRWTPRNVPLLWFSATCAAIIVGQTFLSSIPWWVGLGAAFGCVASVVGLRSQKP
jgi:hypothetical protein